MILKKEKVVKKLVILIKILTINFLISLIIFFSLEIYYRFIYDKSDSFCLLKTNEKWFKRHWRTNTLGFRDIEYDTESIKDKNIIIILGDSLAAGQGIEKEQGRFSNLLEGYINKNNEKKYIVLNFARAGWSSI